MTWDSVPWFVGGGAQHSPEVARLLAYAATSGAEGVIAPGDLKVAPLSPAGSSVRVLAGAALILNKAAGGAQQTYVARNPSEDVVPLAATGSGSGRSDLIVAQIQDPFMPGESWADPADVTVGPYIKTVVFPNVQPTATTPPAGVSGIALARIDIPANTATITAEMVKDVRKLAQPRESRVVDQKVPTSGQILTSKTYINYPEATFSVSVPSWATHAYVTVTLSNVQVDAGNTYGNLRAFFGTVSGPAMNYDINAGDNPSAENIVVTLSTPIDAALRGTSVSVYLQGLRYDPATNPAITSQLRTLNSTQEILDVQFYERPV